MKKLAARVPFERAGVARRARARPAHRRVRPPADGPEDRPDEAGIDWHAFRESQREAAREAVAAALVLDEIARREQIDGDRRRGRRRGRAVRRAAGPHAGGACGRELEKEGGLSRLRAGLRREKAIDFLLARATIVRRLA